MFKKIVNIFLVFALLFSTTGITVYSHYCSGYLVEKSFYINPEGCCKGPCNCCHTDVLSAKVTDSFIGSKFNCDLKDVIKEIIDHYKFPVFIDRRMLSISGVKLSFDKAFVWLLHPLLSFDRTTQFCVFLT